MCPVSIVDSYEMTCCQYTPLPRIQPLQRVQPSIVPNNLRLLEPRGLEANPRMMYLSGQSCSRSVTYHCGSYCTEASVNTRKPTVGTMGSACKVETYAMSRLRRDPGEGVLNPASKVVLQVSSPNPRGMRKHDLWLQLGLESASGNVFM